MRNENYDAAALAETVEHRAVVAQALADQLNALSEKLRLTGDEYDGHAHDHAEEKLAWVAKSARELADSCDSLRQYTNYPPATAPRNADTVDEIERTQRREGNA